MEFHVFHCFSVDIPSCFVCNYFIFYSIMLKFGQDVAQASLNLPALSKIGRFGNRRPQGCHTLARGCLSRKCEENFCLRIG